MTKAIISFLFLAVGASAQIINSGGGSGTGTVNAGTTGAPAIYTGNGTTVGPTGTGSVSGAGTISPSGTGQLAASQDWYQSGPGVISPIPPTLAFSVTGGTFASSTTAFVKVTYVGLSVIEPSGEARQALTGCTGGNQCSVTATMPTSCTAGNLPAGVTGCTVWSSVSTGTEKQQAASAACVNITSATCVIGTAGAGSTLVTPQTGITPVGAQTVTCPDNIIPTNWVQKSDGNFYNLAGVDISGLNLPSPPGTFTFCDRLFVNDTSGPPVIANALVSIHHQEGNTTLSGSSTVDDRALGIEMIDSGTASPITEQSLTQYNERIVSNTNFNCNPIGGGAPWGETCAAAGRFVVSDTRTANVAGATSFEGVAGVAGNNGSSTAQASGTGQSYVGVKGGAFQQVATTNGNAGTWIGGYFGVNAFSGNGGTALGKGILIATPSVRFNSTNRGLEVQDFGTNTSDWDLLILGNGTTSGRSLFQGPLWVPSLVQSNSTIGVTGSLNLTGGVATTQLSSMAGGIAITNFGTAGGVTDTYKVTCVDVNSNETIASAAGNTNTANADLTAAHGNTVTLSTNAGANAGCSSYNIYRTVSASTCNGGACTNGKLGNVAGSLIQANAEAYNSNPFFQDTGQVGDGNTAVAQPNMTGGIKPFNYQTNTNCSSSASPAVCGSAAAGSVAVPTGTNATLQINTTAVTANSQIFMQSDDTLGTRLGVTCNTTLASLIVEPVISTRVAATSFTVTISGTTTVNPVCLSYFIVN